MDEITGTVDFLMEPRFSCTLHPLKLVIVQEDPLLVKFVCEECEKVKVIDGKFHIIDI
jgi:hypothetical protein